MQRQQEEISEMADQLQQRLDALEALVNKLQAQNINLQNKVVNLQNAAAAAAAAAPVIPSAAFPAAAVAASISYAENPGRYDIEQIIKEKRQKCGHSFHHLQLCLMRSNINVHVCFIILFNMNVVTR